MCDMSSSLPTTPNPHSTTPHPSRSTHLHALQLLFLFLTYLGQMFYLRFQSRDFLLEFFLMIFKFCDLVPKVRVCPWEITIFGQCLLQLFLNLQLNHWCGLSTVVFLSAQSIAICITLKIQWVKLSHSKRSLQQLSTVGMSIRLHIFVFL